MDYGSKRRKQLQQILGNLISLPLFAINVVMMNEVRVEDMAVELVASVFLRRMGKTLQVTARKEVAVAVLKSLQLHMGHRTRDVHMGSSTDSTQECLPDEHWARFIVCKERLLRILIQDFSDLFQVDVKDTLYFCNLRSEGCRLLRNICLTGEHGVLFKLMSCGFLGSFMCASAMCDKLEKMDSIIRMEFLKRWSEDVLRVWLCCLDSSAFDIQDENGAGKGSTPGLQLESWAAYIVSCKTIFDSLLEHELIQILSGGANDSDGTCEDTDTIHLSNDYQKDIYKVLQKLHSFCERNWTGPQFLQKGTKEASQVIMMQQLKDISLSIDRHRGQEDYGDVDRSDTLQSCRSFSKKCIALKTLWPMPFSSQHEHNIRSGQPERKQLYEFSVHVFFSICTALFVNTGALRELYEEVAEDIITAVFIELFKK